MQSMLSLTVITLFALLTAPNPALYATKPVTVSKNVQCLIMMNDTVFMASMLVQNSS